MASKGKDTAPIPDFDSPEYDDIFEGGTVERLQDILQAAVSSACHTTELHDTRQQLLTNVIDDALESALTTIDMLFVARDEPAVTATSLTQGSWDPEPAPQPCAPDHWLRAAIPEKQQPTQTYILQQFLRSGGAAAALKSGAAAGSTQRPSLSKEGSFKHRASQSGSLIGSVQASPSLRREVDQQQQGSSRPGSRSGAHPSASPRGRVGGRASQGLRPSAAGDVDDDASKLTDGKAQGVRQKTEAESRLREELEVRRAQEAIASSMAAKDAEAAAQLTEIARKLGNKEYGYDHSGRVVALTDPASSGHAGAAGGGGGLDAGHAPAFSIQQPGSQQAGSTGKSGRKSLSGKSDAASPKRKSKSQHASPDRKLVNDFKETQSKTQPNALEVVVPTAGVTVKSGNMSKVGPQRMTQAGKGMTKDELRRLAETVSSGSKDGRVASSNSNRENSRGGLEPSASKKTTLPPLETRNSTVSRGSQMSGADGIGPASGRPGSRSALTTPGMLDPLPHDAQSMASFATTGRSKLARAGQHTFISEGPLADVPDVPLAATAGAVRKRADADRNGDALRAPGRDQAGSPGALQADPWGRVARLGGGPHAVALSSSGSGAGGGGGFKGSAALSTVKPTDKLRELEVGRAVRLPRDRTSQATGSPPMSPGKLQQQQHDAQAAPRMTFAAK